MATYTTNYNLKKPAENDFILVGDFNDNADIVDAELKKRPVIGEDGKLSDDLLPDLAATYEPKGAADSAVSAHNTSANAHQDIRQAIKGKQDSLAFDTTPTADSNNPVTSGGVKAALDGKAAQVLTGTSAPTNQTVGVVGQLYHYTTENEWYICYKVIASFPAYGWVKLILANNIDEQTVDKANFATDTVVVGTAGLRNQYFVAKTDYTDSNAPTVEGQICWLYG